MQKLACLLLNLSIGLVPPFKLAVAGPAFVYAVNAERVDLTMQAIQQLAKMQQQVQDLNTRNSSVQEQQHRQADAVLASGPKQTCAPQDPLPDYPWVSQCR